MLVSSIKTNEMQITSDMSKLSAFFPTGELGLDNYYEVFAQMEFGRMMFNSTFILLVTVISGVIN